MDYIFGENVEHIKGIVMRNLSAAYFSIGKREEALELNGICLKRAKKKNNGRDFHVLLGDRAAIILELVKTGKKDKAEMYEIKKYLRQSYILAAARGDHICAQVIENAYKKEFGETIVI